MAKIMNIAVYGLNESLIRSGYPMSTTVNEAMSTAVAQYGITEDLVKRGIKLGNTKGGSGHDCFLKGIIVQADFHAPQYWWQQSQRYHWFDIVSSQSKMHRLTEMDFGDTEVCVETLCFMRDSIARYKADLMTFEQLLNEVPMGFEYTAGVSTNYLQLKTMYHQRRHHRLTMWNKVFVEFCEGLPYFNELCLGGK